MTIHILPRSVPRDVAETRSLFLAREAVTLGAISPAFHALLQRLLVSANPAVAREARRLQEAVT